MTITELQLLSSAETGDVGGVRRALAAGVDPDARGSLGTTAMHWATAYGSLPMAKDLLAAKASVNILDDLGVAPLHSASSSGDVPMCELLLDSGAHLEMRNKQGSTPLNEAAKQDRPRAVEFLLGRGACIDVATSKGITPLHSACMNGAPQAARMLLARGARLDATDLDEQMTPLLHAARANSLGCCITIIEWVDANGLLTPSARQSSLNDALHVAFDRGRLRTSMGLIAYGANPKGIATSLSDVTPMQAAVAEGLTQRLAWLLHNQPSNDPGDRLPSLLSMAQKTGKQAIIALLCAHSAQSTMKQIRARAQECTAPSPRR